MSKLLSCLGIWVFRAALLCVTPLAMAQQADLSATLRANGNDVYFELTNNGSQPLSILRWETPLEPELTQDVFSITTTSTGKLDIYAERARYAGRLLKRGETKPEDYFHINPGQTISSVVPVSDYYELPQDGLYTVSFAGQFEVVAQTQDRSILSLADADNVVSVYSNAVAMQLVSKPPIAFARAGSYDNCSAQQQGEIAGDLDAAEVITRDARLALSNLPQNERAGSPRYTHWFGDYNASRYDSVLNIYRKAESVIADGSIDFNCNCSEAIFAFIYKIDPYKVYLCPLYWRAERNGTDSRAGTIVHELSHFPEIGDTNDEAYGATAVATLARERPAVAVVNADNVEYFAENTPFRAISNGASLPTVVEYRDLQLSNAVAGSGNNDTLLYRVDGADYIELNSIEGDADLYVFSDADRVRQICQSIFSTAIDRCVLPNRQTAYVEVVNNGNARFTILAATNTPVTTSLVLGQTQTFNIAANELQYFSVSGAELIRVNSLSGDADLYIHTDESRQGAAACSSINFSDSSTIDSCPGGESTVYVTVQSNTDSRYEIIATAQPVVVTETNPPVDQNPDTGSNTGGSGQDDIDSINRPVVVSTGGNSGGGQLGLGFLIALMLLVRKSRAVSNAPVRLLTRGK